MELKELLEGLEGVVGVGVKELGVKGVEMLLGLEEVVVEVEVKLIQKMYCSYLQD